MSTKIQKITKQVRVEVDVHKMLREISAKKLEPITKILSKMVREQLAKN